ncbi:MAG TPA: hypothetical protein VKC99_09720 [Methyloceanibacter sp.]|nr:hypothetical protein [Methyloceanibacter sp.]
MIQFRRDSYAAVFDGIIEEENELSALYEPRALLEAAKTHLLSVWERGSSADVADAMAKFRETYERNLLDHARVDRNNTKAFREWKGRISAWLYGTDHIRIVYGVQYEGVDIEQLSPGPRGIAIASVPSDRLR